MWATGTEVRRAAGKLHHRRGLRAGGSDACERRRHTAVTRSFHDTRTNTASNHTRAEITIGGKQRCSILSVLADDLRRVRHTVKVLAYLVLDEPTLLLDDDNFIEAVGESQDPRSLERPGHRHLVHPDTEINRARLVEAEIGQCLKRVSVGFAYGDDSQ